MSGPTVGVKFLLQGGQWLMIKMPKAAYQHWLENCQASGEPKTLSGTCMASGMLWIVVGKQVVGSHTFDWEAAQAQMATQQQQQASQANLYRRLSGN